MISRVLQIIFLRISKKSVNRLGFEKLNVTGKMIILYIRRR